MQTAAEQIAKRQHAVDTAGYWFRCAREAQNEGKMAEALLYMENAYNHTENALLAERDQRDRLTEALRQKDAGMGVLFDRLNKAGVDCSDLIS